MKRYEPDFRYDWVALTLHALQSGFGTIRKRGGEEPWFDGLWQMEHAESILGIAFVTAQAYIVGTVEDVNKIREIAGKRRLDKINYYSDDVQPLANAVSRISLINSLANYYKHHDEWDRWQACLTTRTLAEVGIVETTDFPCYAGAAKLWDQTEFENLENLLKIISEWRKYILSKYQ